VLGQRRRSAGPVGEHLGGSASASNRASRWVCDQRGGVEFRFEDRLIFGVHEGHRHGAHFKQRVFRFRLVLG
jgi:hypothetical protein